MTPLTGRLSAAWGLLVGATLLTFWAAGHFGTLATAIGVSMALAAVKVLVVLHRFMELGRTALPFRLFFYFWTIGCAAMIWGIALASG